MALCKEGQFLLSLLSNAVFKKSRSLTKCQISIQESNWKLHLNNTRWENRRRIWKNCSQLCASWDISFSTFAPIAITVISCPLALINIVLASTLIALVVNHLTSVATAVKPRDQNKKIPGNKADFLPADGEWTKLAYTFWNITWKNKTSDFPWKFQCCESFQGPLFLLISLKLDFELRFFKEFSHGRVRSAFNDDRNFRCMEIVQSYNDES